LGEIAISVTAARWNRNQDLAADSRAAIAMTRSELNAATPLPPFGNDADGTGAPDPQPYVAASWQVRPNGIMCLLIAKLDRAERK